VRPDRERLEGSVEVDETYLGGAEEGVHGRETENKAIVAVAAEEDGRGIGRIRLRRIADVSADSLHPFVEQSVTPGAVVHTDGWPAYNGIEAKGYTHKVTVLSQRDEAAHQLMPRVHRVASLLKRWLLGTHQGAVSGKHLDYYLDEYTFRFNRRPVLVQREMETSIGGLGSLGVSKLFGGAWIFRIGVVSEGGGRRGRRRPGLAHNPWVGARVASPQSPILRPGRY
jgi:transposase-like protein